MASFPLAKQSRFYVALLATCYLFIANGQVIAGGESLDQRIEETLAHFEAAEARFRPPDRQWFDATQQALIKEATRVDAALQAQGADYALAWKNHLRWNNLTKNLGEPESVEVAELALVRRWLYSNREGLEYPFFAELRSTVDAHLDAATTFAYADLEQTYRAHLSELRQQLRTLAAAPTDANAATVGRTLGWLEMTRQLPDEVAAARSLISLPNAQIIVAKPMIDRAIALLATEVEQSLPVTDRVTVPNASLLGRERTANVRGTATTHGAISVDLRENDTMADLRLVYQGEIDSRCRALIGPVSVAMRTLGPVQAITPVQLSLQGVNLLTTNVEPEVHTRVTGVSASNELFRRIGRRRVSEPESSRQMNNRASYKAASLLQEEMDDRVNSVLEDIRAELEAARSSFDNFGEVLAPVVREGATPRWHSIQSTSDDVIVNGISQRREQLGSPTYYPPTDHTADVQVRLHTSFFNNMGETIMAGKTFTDKYFMRYGRILQAELPPPLMVHARSVRWAIVAEKPRPLEVSIPSINQFLIKLRMQRVEIGDEQFTGPTVATILYELVRNEFNEYYLERIGSVELDSPLPAEQKKFLLSKMNAFFAPVLDGAGVALPEGGSLGRLRGLQPQGAVADQNWLTLGVNVPDEFLEQWLPLGETGE